MSHLAWIWHALCTCRCVCMNMTSPHLRWKFLQLLSEIWAQIDPSRNQLSNFLMIQVRTSYKSRLLYGEVIIVHLITLFIYTLIIFAFQNIFIFNSNNIRYWYYKFYKLYFYLCNKNFNLNSSIIIQKKKKI